MDGTSIRLNDIFIADNKQIDQNGYLITTTTSSDQSSSITPPLPPITITNPTSSSSNSISAFTEDDEYEQSPPSSSSSTSSSTETSNQLPNLRNSINSLATNSNDSFAPSPLSRVVNQSSSSSTTSSSSSSSTTSSNSSKTSNNLQPVSQQQQQQQLEQLIHHQPNTKYIFILNAFVNGFAQLKLCADKTDFEYIIEIYWSNETKSFVKRTFDDFVLFHRKLTQTFSQFFNDLINNNKKNKSTFRINNSTPNSNNKKDSKIFSSAILGNSLDQHLMPVLPASKKPFWISHLKLAESREIELNNYVQRLLKLPTKISHSPLVLQFFESQTSDPKPAKISILRTPNNNNNTNQNSSSEHGSDSFGDDRDYDDLDDDDVNHVNNMSDENDLDNNSNYDDENEDDDDDDDVDDDDDEQEDDLDSNLNDDEFNNNSNNIINSNNSNFNNDNSNNSKRNRHSIGLNNGLSSMSRSRRKINQEPAGLWWDEDEALNELTSSMSFEFGSHLAQSQCNTTSYNQHNDLDEDDELETLKTLETMLKNSDLFCGDLKNDNLVATTITSSSTTVLSNNDNLNAIKRLSLC